MSGIYLNVINSQMIADDTLASIITVLSVGVFQVNFFLAFSVKRPIVLYCIVFTSLGLRAQAGSSNSEKTEELQNAENVGLSTPLNQKKHHTHPQSTPKPIQKPHQPKNKRDNVSPHPRCCYLYITVQYIEVRHGEKRHRMNMHIYTGK